MVADATQNLDFSAIASVVVCSKQNHILLQMDSFLVDIWCKVLISGSLKMKEYFHFIYKYTWEYSGAIEGKLWLSV